MASTSDKDLQRRLRAAREASRASGEARGVTEKIDPKTMSAVIAANGLAQRIDFEGISKIAKDFAPGINEMAKNLAPPHERRPIVSPLRPPQPVRLAPDNGLEEIGNAIMTTAAEVTAANQRADAEAARRMEVERRERWWKLAPIFASAATAVLIKLIFG